MTVSAEDAAGVRVPAFGQGATQSVAYTGTAGTITNAVGKSTQLVEVLVTSDAHIAVGSAPTATADDRPVPAWRPIVVKVRPGIDKVSAIQSASGGTLYVTELT